MAIQSVSRAFQLLRTISENPSVHGVSALANKMNVHKSTVSRLIATLEEEKAIKRLDSGFQIGEGIADLVGGRNSAETLKQTLTTLARPILNTIIQKTNETSGITIQTGSTSTTILQIHSNHQLRVRDWTNESFPLHTSSSGKHFLSHFTRTQLNAYLTTFLTPHNQFSIKKPEKLRQVIAKARTQGYDWTENEFEEGLVAISAPVLDQNKDIIAAVYLCGPTFRFIQNGNRSHYINLIKTAGSTLTERVIQRGITAGDFITV